jgi:predicted DNA-binding transcriptional regulator YafY
MSPTDRGGAKWDRAARYLKIATVLHAHGERGISAADLATRVGVSKRTVYRDLDAMDLEAGLPIWNEDGRFGLAADAFLPPLALTLHEAMAFLLAARVLAKATDELDTEVIGAYVKLAQVLPPVLAEHLRATVDAYASTPRNETFTRVLRTLTEALAARRVVHIEYGPGVYDPAKPARRTRVHPWAIEPSALTRALYLIGWDEDRGARRTFKVERIRAATLTPETFEPAAGAIAKELLHAWDVVSDDDPVTVVLRFSANVAARVAETRWHPSQELEQAADGTLTWRARVSGLLEIRSWVLGWGAAVEVLGPPELHDWVARELARAAARYEPGHGMEGPGRAQGAPTRPSSDPQRPRSDPQRPRSTREAG